MFRLSIQSSSELNEVDENVVEDLLKEDIEEVVKEVSLMEL